MSSIQAVREALVKASRRHTRVAHEIEDIAQDILLSALRRGLALDSDAFVRSTRAAARQHAAFVARSATRRHARELSQAIQQHANGIDAATDEVEGTPLSALPPALRTTVLLLCLGLEKAELRLALGITDPALRKRIQALRALAPLARPALALPDRPPALTRLRASQVRLVPQLSAASGPRLLAVGDPDGHGIIFAEVLTSRRSAATPLGSAANTRQHSEGIPCSTTNSRTSPSSSSSPT